MFGTCVWLCVGLAIAATAVPTAEDSRDLAYEPYDSPGYPEKWQLSSLGANEGECSGVLKPLLAGLLFGAVLKLPLLLLGKLLLLKATAPLAVVAALLPLGMFSVYRNLQQQQDNDKPVGRLIPIDCLHAAACNLGSIAPKSAVGSATWVLKLLEDGRESENSRFDVSSYREAYLKGASSKSCSTYSCPYL